MISNLSAADAGKTLTDSPSARGKVRGGGNCKISESFMYR
ncbi:hypothetical protein CBA19CS11_19380 [Caballeronia novacaledonica]|nr:hypothetical protein CBA19CS11_19380 [Caballeronia novacaledonica]